MMTNVGTTADVQLTRAQWLRMHAVIHMSYVHSTHANHEKHGGLSCGERCSPINDVESQHCGLPIPTHVQELPFPLDAAL